MDIIEYNTHKEMEDLGVKIPSWLNCIMANCTAFGLFTLLFQTEQNLNLRLMYMQVLLGSITH